MLSSFIHPLVVPNLYDLLSSVEHKISYLKNVTKQFVCSFVFLFIMTIFGPYNKNQ